MPESRNRMFSSRRMERSKADGFFAPKRKPTVHLHCGRDDFHASVWFSRQHEKAVYGWLNLDGSPLLAAMPCSQSRMQMNH